MTTIPFTKTTTAGNDFLHVDQSVLPKSLQPLSPEKEKLVRGMCRRQDGIGADGVIFYGILDKKISFSIFNRDGTEAELSGNGLAGVSATILFLQKAASPLKIRTRAGWKTIELINKNHNEFYLRVEIGEPDFSNLDHFPFLEKGKWGMEWRGLDLYPVSVGNPHIVAFPTKTLTEKEMIQLGKKICLNPIFPQQTNVEFVKLGHAKPHGAKIPPAIKVFFYERGVGPTLASSTGSAAVYAVLSRLEIIRDPLTITTPIGTLTISGHPGIFIESATRLICQGKFFL